MEGKTDDTETPQPPPGAWPAEVWLAGEEPKEEGHAEHARGNIVDKLEDVKEKLGPTVEHLKETLDPKLEKAKGKVGQALDKISAKLFPKK
jgi:uncharacterized protein YjbJ (UPF0337 family)